MNNGSNDKQGGGRMRIGLMRFREENEMWVCYWDQETNKKDSVIMLGSVRLSVISDPSVRHAFMHAMKGAFAKAVYDVTGTVPVFDEPTTEETPKQ